MGLPYTYPMHVVEEEFRHTAADANALQPTHQRTSSQGLGLQPLSSDPPAFTDSAHSLAERSQGGQQPFSCTRHVYPYAVRHNMRRDTDWVVCRLRREALALGMQAGFS